MRSVAARTQLLPVRVALVKQLTAEPAEVSRAVLARDLVAPILLLDMGAALRAAGTREADSVRIASCGIASNIPSSTSTRLHSMIEAKTRRKQEAGCFGAFSTQGRAGSNTPRLRVLPYPLVACR